MSSLQRYKKPVVDPRDSVMERVSQPLETKNSPGNWLEKAFSKGFRGRNKSPKLKNLPEKNPGENF